jgi:hypothetical protein
MLHGQQNAKKSRELVQLEPSCSVSDGRMDRLDEYNNSRFSQFCEKQLKTKDKRIPSIFKDESTGSCICLWKLAAAVATYVSICIVYSILLSFAF